MTIWFTSDQHIGHTNIIKHCYRPFHSTWEMQESIITKFNERVSVNDTTYHLGDFFWGRFDYETFKRFNGHHKLVPGNHDPCHPMRSKHNKFKKLYEQSGLEVLNTQVEIEFEHIGIVLLSHFPEKKCSIGLDVRYPELRPLYSGVVICGHVHDRWKAKCRCINVGVDAWNYYPVSESCLMELVSFMRSKDVNHTDQVSII